MIMQVLEGLFLIAFVGLILSKSDQFSYVVRAIGTSYVQTVQGLRG